MSDPRQPVFLARETYRRRRLMDAARLLPFIAAFIFLIPILFAEQSGTAMVTVFLFFAWIALIALSYLISRRLAPDVDTPPADGEDR